MKRTQVLGFLPLLLLPLGLVLCEDDTECLRKFRESVTDPNGSLVDWNFGNAIKGHLCTFTGVTCWNALENKVLSLKLPNAGLSGSFPLGLNLCMSLTSLDLSSNMFSGQIPSTLCAQMPFLTSLDLSRNQFTGSIPSALGDCEYLNILHLNQNQLSGELPWSVGALPRLSNLDLSSNSLTGLIPSSYINRTAVPFQDNPGLCGPPLGKSCSSSGSKVAIIVGASIAVAALIALLFALCLWWMLLRAQKKDHALLRDEHKWAKRIQGPKSITVSLFTKPLVRLRLSDLMTATHDFSKDSIIATTRTGTVYQALLADGSMLAIKRLHSTPHTDKQFKSELTTLGELRHRNLVPLLGYCVAGREKLLVYKHMVNGSLKDFLHELPEKSKPDWTSRLRIAIGAARGLAWLHHSCNPRIIHRNVSSSSILLDDEYEARITDFGLARLMNPSETHVSTFVNGDLGDVGYVAPDYARTLVATVKCDVYSFGVVLLELVTGQKAMEVCAESGFKGNLAEWVVYLASNGRVEEAIDMTLQGKGAGDGLGQFLRVACACIASTPNDRPTMYEVFQLLRAIGQKFDISDDDELAVYTDAKDAKETDELIGSRWK